MTHIFFVDDSYIYCQANKCQANKEEATQVMKVLATFERASGQKLMWINQMCFSVVMCKQIHENQFSIY